MQLFVEVQGGLMLEFGFCADEYFLECAKTCCQ